MLTSAIFIPTLLTVGSSGALFGIIAMWCKLQFFFVFYLYSTTFLITR